jgi:hypothetical protein
MDKIEKDYIINIDDTISNFRAELVADTNAISSSSPIQKYIQPGSGEDLSLAWRKAELTKILTSLNNNKERILDAIVEDFQIDRTEAEIYEFNPIVYDIEKLIAGYQKWTVNEVDLASEELGSGVLGALIGGIKSNLGLESGPQCKIVNLPYGVTLVLGSQKSELTTLLKPLCASISAGNYNIVKPNIGKDENLVTSTDLIVTEILKDCLDPQRTLILDDDYDFMSLIEKAKVDLVFTRKNKN